MVNRKANRTRAVKGVSEIELCTKVCTNAGRRLWLASYVLRAASAWFSWKLVFSSAQNVATLVRVLPLEPVFPRVLDVRFTKWPWPFLHRSYRNPDVPSRRSQSFRLAWRKVYAKKWSVATCLVPIQLNSGLGMAKERQIKAMKSSTGSVRRCSMAGSDLSGLTDGL